MTNWLVNALRAAIADGRLRVGATLPATRILADDLGVSRGVVVEAYRRLGDEGLVNARTGVGTVVTPLRSAPHAVKQAPVGGRSAAEPLAPPLPLPQLVVPVEVDLSPGVPDLSAFPRAAWLRAERAVLNNATASDLGYGDPRGNARLRQELAGWLARIRGIRANADDIIIVAGVAQSLALLAQRQRAQGATTIAVEDPGSRGARDELAHWGLEPVPVPVDEHGLRVAELARTGLPAALLTPAHQFPTGVVLTPQRRRALLDWATAGGLIVEDDYDAEYRYDRAPVPALQASAPAMVAYTGSTSKTLAPGMRLGWLIPPRRLHADLVAAKHASDLGSPAIPQLVLAHLIAAGELDRHVRLMRARHRTRRDALLTALRQHLPQARVQGVAAGLHLLITLPDRSGKVDDTDLAERIRQAGVLVHPLSWHRQRSGPPGLVIGYAAHPPDRLREAARRIGVTVEAATQLELS
ncbi:GntR family transcriptional regulator [Asanoa ishikariensis]|uniref:GntR family transcriptional regulator / MocR family aminotransferase n=1 Tax=Asanoa ishikariensis TaxID=137265 RepID=A0A1H3UUA6_9ACTN|nr:PLP-dependent aminotransferase family protein [Asanoa ishikariensis]GIF69455.1 GntR family transcriptional regulator [Asanoa ishikariensis]SDZ65379.1 GntR family transcriptional regulator / MocR family aminotransferase [Asanoa ishikariensis]